MEIGYGRWYLKYVEVREEKGASWQMSIEEATQGFLRKDWRSQPSRCFPRCFSNFPSSFHHYHHHALQTSLQQDTRESFMRLPLSSSTLFLFFFLVPPVFLRLLHGEPEGNGTAGDSIDTGPALNYAHRLGQRETNRFPLRCLHTTPRTAFCILVLQKEGTYRREKGTLWARRSRCIFLCIFTLCFKAFGNEHGDGVIEIRLFYRENILP